MTLEYLKSNYNYAYSVKQNYPTLGWVEQLMIIITTFTIISVATLHLINIVLRMLKKRGPTPLTVLDRIVDNIHMRITKKRLFYRIPVFKEHMRVNVTLARDYARYDKTILRGYCRDCCIYGHDTSAIIHGKSVEALALAEVCSIDTFAARNLETISDYKLMNVKAFEKNPKLFVEKYGRNDVYPTRIAIAKCEDLQGLKTLKTPLGTIYLNNYSEIPHMYFYGYNDETQLKELFVKLSILVESLTIYTDIPFTNNDTMIMTITKKPLVFVHDTDLYDLVISELKQSGTPAMLRVIKEVDFDDTRSICESVKSLGRVGRKERARERKYTTLTRGNVPAARTLSESESPPVKLERPPVKEIVYTNSAYKNLMPNFAFTLMTIVMLCIPTQAVIVKYTTTPSDQLQTKAPSCIYSLDTPVEYLKYKHFSLINQECFKFAEDIEYKHLFRLSLRTAALNLENIQKPKSFDGQFELFANGKNPLLTNLVSQPHTIQQFNLLHTAYNMSVYVMDRSETSRPEYKNEQVIYATNEYFNEAIQYAKLIQVVDAPVDCVQPQCILFNGLDETVGNFDIQLTASTTRTMKHAPNQNPIIINPACYEIAICTEYEKPLKTKAKLMFPAEFYENSKWFINYQVSIFDAFMDGDLMERDFRITRHTYESPNCPATTSTGKCIYEPEEVDIVTVTNHLGFIMQCGATHQFCLDMQHTFEDVKVENEQQIDASCVDLKEYIHNIGMSDLEQYINVVMTDYTEEKHVTGMVFVYKDRGDLLLRELIQKIIACYIPEETILKNAAVDLNYDNLLKGIHIVTDIQNIPCDLLTLTATYGDYHLPASRHGILVSSRLSFMTMDYNSLKDYEDPNGYNDLGNRLEAYFTAYGSVCGIGEDRIAATAVRLSTNVFNEVIESTQREQIKLKPDMKPVVSPTPSKVVTTMQYYTNYVMNNVADVTHDVFEEISEISNPWLDRYYAALYNFYDRIERIKDSYYNYRLNIQLATAANADHYRKYYASYAETEYCEFLHHSDTMILYMDCVHDKLEPLYLMKVRIGSNGYDFKIITVHGNYSTDKIDTFFDAIGYEYRGRNYIFYRPLFTIPNQVVPAYFAQRVQHCKLSKPQDEIPAFAADNTICYPYITGFAAIDEIIANYMNITWLIQIVALITVTSLCLYSLSEKYFLVVRVAFLFIALVRVYLSAYLEPMHMFSALLSYFIYTSVSDAFTLVINLSLLLICLQGVKSLFENLRKYQSLIHLITLISLTSLEFLVYITYYWRQYIAGSEMVCLSVVTLVFTLYYTCFIYFSNPTYKRPYVRLVEAHEDWVKYVQSLRPHMRTDEAAKKDLVRIMQSELSAIDADEFARASYLSQCYTETVLAGTYDPNAIMHVKKLNIRAFMSNAALANLACIADSTKLHNETQHNPSIRFRPVPILTLEMDVNPEIVYVDKGVRVSLYGAIVAGHIYIERHLFGNDLETFKRNYNNGLGLSKCPALKRSVYDISNARMIKTMIRIPLLEPQSDNFKLHPNPMEYTGPVQMYTRGFVVNGFINEGRHNITTQFGDCGGMLFDTKAQFLGLHCAGSDDVIFRDFSTKEKRNNIWTGYKLTYPGELMITLDSTLGLPETEDYDFKHFKVEYHHPIRSVEATLGTLQYLTNPQNNFYPYDKRLLSDFNITQKQYEQYGKNVNYDDFVNNFETYTRSLIGHMTFEQCIQYGIKNVRAINKYIDNQSYIPSKKTYVKRPPMLLMLLNMLNILDFIIELVFINPVTAIKTIPYLLADTVLLWNNLSWKWTLFTLWRLFWLAHVFVSKFTLQTLFGESYVVVFYFTNCLIILTNYNSSTEVGMLRTPPKFLQILSKLKNKSTTAKRMAESLGSQHNLCILLSSLLKVLKPNRAFRELSTIVNLLDDLQANWKNLDEAEACKQLDDAIQEMFALYPVLFHTITGLTDYEEQVKLILSYINENGDFDMNEFDTKHNLLDIASNQCRDAIQYLSNNKTAIEFDIEKIEKVNLSEFIEYFIKVTSTKEQYTHQDYKTLEHLTDKLVEHIKRIKQSEDAMLSLDFNDCLYTLTKHTDMINLESINTRTPKERNIMQNAMTRVLSQMKRLVNAQANLRMIQHSQQEKSRQKEANISMDQNNRIKKLQRQNQSIASAIVMMIHSCFVNKFLLTNKSQVCIQKLITALGKEAILVDLDDDYRSIMENFENSTSKNQATNTTTYTTMQAVLWTGSTYSQVPSICGKKWFTCRDTQDTEHIHNYINCNRYIFDSWYKHCDDCGDCTTTYENGVHPVCRQKYDHVLIRQTRIPRFHNFIRRYRSCPQCIPCSTCVLEREPTCTYDGYHATTTYQIPPVVIQRDASNKVDQAYLAPTRITAETLEYKTEQNGAIEVVKDGRKLLLRKPQRLPTTPNRYRYLHINIDPNGHYYVSDSCPTDVALLNAMINHVVSLVREQEAEAKNENETNTELIISPEQTRIKVLKETLTDELIGELREKHRMLAILQIPLHFESTLAQTLENNDPEIVIYVSDIKSRLANVSLYANNLRLGTYSFDKQNQETEEAQILRVISSLQIRPDFSYGTSTEAGC